MHENTSALSPSSLRTTTLQVSSVETSVPDVSSTPEVTLTQIVSSSPSTSHITMTIPSHTTTQTSSLISTGINIPPIDEMRDEFNEDFVISLGEYRYSKTDKSMVKRGKKRSRDYSEMDISLSSQVVWTQRSSDPQVDAIDAAIVLGAFIGANFDAVNTLNREFDKQKAEIVSLKEELEQLKRQHENMYDELQVKNVSLHDEL